MTGVIKLEIFWPFWSKHFTVPPRTPDGVFQQYCAYWVKTRHGTTTLVPGDFVATYPDGTQDVQCCGFRGGLDAISNKEGK